MFGNFSFFLSFSRVFFFFFVMDSSLPDIISRPKINCFLCVFLSLENPNFSPVSRIIWEVRGVIH